jgi:hypothetical protein
VSVSDTRTKMWRVLVRIQSVKDGTIFFVVPAWSWRVTLQLPLRSLPPHVRDFVLEIKEFPCRIHAYMNMGEERQERLRFDEWELK